MRVVEERDRQQSSPSGSGKSPPEELAGAGLPGRACGRTQDADRVGRARGLWKSPRGRGGDRPSVAVGGLDEQQQEIGGGRRRPRACLAPESINKMGIQFFEHAANSVMPASAGGDDDDGPWRRRRWSIFRLRHPADRPFERPFHATIWHCLKKKAASRPSCTLRCIWSRARRSEDRSCRPTPALWQIVDAVRRFHADGGGALPGTGGAATLRGRTRTFKRTKDLPPRL